MNYYNDIDPFCCSWIENLIRAGLIPNGDVDCRPIQDVNPDGLRRYTQAHFFAGCGGWPIALRLAGWPDDFTVFTGSCPCEPFSIAGKGLGVKDDRHLWPAFRWIVSQLRPQVVCGEQVAKRAGVEWMCGVQNDMEAIGYEVEPYDLPACSVGAWHIRQRMFWMAHLDSPGWKWPRPVQPKKWWRNLFRSWFGEEVSNTKSEGWKDVEGGKGSSKQDRRKKPVPGVFRPRVRQWEPEPVLVRVVHGISKNSRAVSAYGRAIVPQVAAEFVMAFMDVYGESNEL